MYPRLALATFAAALVVATAAVVPAGASECPEDAEFCDDVVHRPEPDPPPRTFIVELMSDVAYPADQPGATTATATTGAPIVAALPVTL